MSSEMGTEVVTGGKPVEAFTRAVEALPNRGFGWFVNTIHDDGCPALKTDDLRTCNCEIIWLHAEETRVYRTYKVPAQYQAVPSDAGALGWKPPLLHGDEPEYVRLFWINVLTTVEHRLLGWEPDYWRRRLIPALRGDG